MPTSHVIQFPAHELASPEGIIAVGGELSAANVVHAYLRGIFPWPHAELPTLWFSPPQRGIIDFNDLKIPNSFKKFIRKSDFKLTVDEQFREVIQSCAKVERPGQTGTWISQEIESVYQELFVQGHAHSIECWMDRQLVGGLYGVYIGGVFSGESMFYTEPNASKFCLYGLILALKTLGLSWMDTQMVTPVVEHFGGRYIDRSDFLQRLSLAQTGDIIFDRARVIDAFARFC
jgi:leucyl/phenylalanyl-tRNA---protein transferase